MVSMRRSLTIFSVLLCSCLPLAACSSSHPADSAANPDALVRATGAFDARPVIAIPDTDPGSTAVYSTPIRGHGPDITASDAVLFNWVIYYWSGSRHKLGADSYDTAPQLMGSQWLPAPGLRHALVGKRIGSRIVAVLPPAQAGDPPGVHITMIFAIDLLRAYSGAASAYGRRVTTGGGDLPAIPLVPAGAQPVIKVPPSPVRIPEIMHTQVLIDGSGRRVAYGDDAIAQVVGAYWNTGQVFESTWQQQGLALIPVTRTDSPPGLAANLADRKIGSRLLIVIPVKQAFSSGQRIPAAARNAGALVFVVDIVDAINQIGLLQGVRR
jgi:peptidylprolyl isomerase